MNPPLNQRDVPLECIENSAFTFIASAALIEACCVRPWLSQSSSTGVRHALRTIFHQYPTQSFILRTASLFLFFFTVPVSAPQINRGEGGNKTNTASEAMMTQSSAPSTRGESVAAALTANRSMQAHVATRLTLLDDRLAYLSHVQLSLRRASTERTSSPSATPLGEKRPASLVRATVAFDSPIQPRTECTDSCKSDGASLHSSPPPLSTGTVCAYSRQPLTLRCSTIFHADGTRSDPFRVAGVYAEQMCQRVRFVPVPPTGDEARHKRICAVYVPNVASVSGTAPAMNASLAAMPSASRVPPFSRSADTRIQPLLDAFAARTRHTNIVRFPGAPKVAPSMQKAIAWIVSLGATIDSVVAAHWCDAGHLQTQLCHYFVHLFQMHYPKAEWLTQFTELLNLPLSCEPPCFAEEMGRCRCLTLCDEVDLITTAAAEAELTLLRTVGAHVRGAGLLAHAMIGLLEGSDGSSPSKLRFATEKCGYVAHLLASEGGSV